MIPDYEGQRIIKLNETVSRQVTQARSIKSNHR